jgi:hypothetical protein
MREPERIWMSQKERDRLQVLHQIEKEQVSQKQAAPTLVAQRAPARTS